MKAARTFVPLLALALLALWSLATLRLDSDLFALFPQDLAEAKQLRLMQSAFQSEGELIVVLPDAEKTAQVEACLKAVPGVASVFPYRSESTAIPVEMGAYLASQLPPEAFEKFAAQLQPETITLRLQELKQTLSGSFDGAQLRAAQLDPLNLAPLLGLPEEFLSSGLSAPPPSTHTKVSALLVKPASQKRDYLASQQLVKNVRTALDSADLGSGVLLSGPPAFAAFISAQMRGDMMRMTLFALASVALLFWLFYRRWRPLFALLPLLLAALAVSLQVGQFIFGSINLISIGFASILIGVGVDYFVLVYHHFASGGDEHEWPVLVRGIWFSAVTTAATFGVLFFTDFPGLQQLALLLAVGLISCAALATVLLPFWLKGKPGHLPTLISTLTKKARMQCISVGTGFF